MKKLFRKKFGIFALTAILGSCALAGMTACGEEEETEKSSQETVTQTNSNPYATAVDLFENGCYYLADFETYEQITQMKLGWSFGKVTPTTEESAPAQMPIHGEQCIKAEVLGREELWGKRPPFLGFKTTGKYFSKTDFSDCDAFLADMYNAMDYELTVKFFVNDIRYPAYDSGMWFRYEFKLRPGYNAVEIPVDETLLENSPPEGIYKNVSMVGFIFDRGELHEETQTVYIDNFRARKKA